MAEATDVVLDIIMQLAREQETFTSDDIRPHLPDGIGSRSIPPAVAKARRDGLIEEVGRVKSTIPERKGSPVAVYRRPGSALALVRSTPSQASVPGSDDRISSTGEEVVALKDYLVRIGYICGVEEIATVLLMLASRGWLILSGPSGTGKSSLVRHLCNAVEGEFHDIQVKPNWVSSEDSLGYFSEVSHTFVPGILLTAFMRANNSPGFHFVRLDEMNLAAPEYYLAEVLSAAESWEVRDGELVSDQIQLPPAATGVNMPSVRISNRVFLIGTVNVDETTRALSPKVLDRAAVLDLHHVDLFTAADSAPVVASAERPELPALQRLLLDRPRSVASLGYGADQLEAVAQVLASIADVAGALGGPIGYRQRDAILSLLVLAEKHELGSILMRDSVIDIGLRSCVMTKWQGSSRAASSALRRALGALLEKDLPDDASLDVLRAEAAVSRFPRSADRLLSMIGQQETFGYFSAW